MFATIKFPLSVLTFVLASFSIWSSAGAVVYGQAKEPVGLGRSLETERLIAWCIVPFDAEKRTPAERVAMLQELGLSRVAYDWRAEHVASFEEEFLAYQRAGLELFAFWDVHESALALFEKHDLHPQIWKIMPTPEGSDAERVQRAAEGLRPLVDRTRELGCELGLYNHGGWSGEPENLAAVVEELRRGGGADHVGIVYNFHHGHEHIEEFQRAVAVMKPYLLCVNINGMVASGTPKILPVGKGDHEVEMVRILEAQGYDGPIGILDHRPELDARKSLELNLKGVAALRSSLEK